MTASKSAGFTLSNSLLTSTDGMSLTLSKFTTANLTDTGGGGNTINVTGWTGGGTFKGTSETLIAGASANTTLSNTSLAVTGLPTLTWAGSRRPTSATPRAVTRSRSVAGREAVRSRTRGVLGDTVTSSKAGGFSLSNTSLLSSGRVVAGSEQFHDGQPDGYDDGGREYVCAHGLDGRRVAEGEQPRR